MSSDITYSFKILKLNVMPSFFINSVELKNVVTSVIYQYIGLNSKNGQTCVVTGEAIMAPPSLDDYKEFHELTQEEVLNWLNKIDVTKFQRDINNYLTGNNIISMGLPWIG